MTTCASGVERLADYLEGVLSADTRAELEAHLRGCARCTAFVASYRATPAILRLATSVDPPAALAGSLRRRVRRDL